MDTTNMYTPNMYKGEFNLLAGEKKLIIRALKNAEGSVKVAHHLLCPENKPYGYTGLLRVIYKHQIDSHSYKKHRLNGKK
tara:strand:- start:17700 stop:17939 length:240 start_codon:yes stop_codon:yes gene_type:complete